jgi:glycosyltransferase involved in cell wall biosynthesis
MLISYNTDLGNLNTKVGYGVAGYNIVSALQGLGHTVAFEEPSAPVELWFCQPEYWDFSGQRNGQNPDQYKIGYAPWESTILPDMWFPGLADADEVWTTSEWCKNVFEDNGIPNVRVYEHGIDGEFWRPLRRRASRKLKFLHVGEPAPRKGGSKAVEAFLDLFENNNDVHLTIKAHTYNTIRVRRGGSLKTPDAFSNITVIAEEMTEDELLGLYLKHDVLVYPSYGEGFGFIPLQALSTGMPTICTGEWAPYKRFLGNLAVDSHEINTPWEIMHPGNVLEPDDDDLRDKMLFVYNNFDGLSRRFYAQAKDVQAAYNWQTLTKNAFEHIVQRFS